MAYEFTRLSDVPSIEAFPETGNVLIEDSGEIKKCKTDGLGGGKIEVIELIFDTVSHALTGPTDKTPEEYWEAMKAGTTFIIDITSIDGLVHYGTTFNYFMKAEGQEGIGGYESVGYVIENGVGTWTIGN